jgi:cell shape-determining protein MreD
MVAMVFCLAAAVICVNILTAGTGTVVMSLWIGALLSIGLVALVFATMLRRRANREV